MEHDAAAVLVASANVNEEVAKKLTSEMLEDLKHNAIRNKYFFDA